MKAERDPSLYRKMCEPHESRDALNERFDAFYADLRRIREIHRMRDVLVVISGSALTDSGEEGEFITQANCGDPMKMEQLAAYALGSARRDREAMTAEILKGK